MSPAVLPVTDVLTGLQTGLIDIAFASPVAALVLQWHTKVKYITELPISYSMGIFAIEKSAYAALSADGPADRPRGHGPLHRRRSIARRATTIARAAEVLRDPACKRSPSTPPTSTDWRRTIESLYPRLRDAPGHRRRDVRRLLGVARRLPARAPVTRDPRAIERRRAESLGGTESIAPAARSRPAHRRDSLGGLILSRSRADRAAQLLLDRLHLG